MIFKRLRVWGKKIHQIVFIKRVQQWSCTWCVYKVHSIVQQYGSFCKFLRVEYEHANIWFESYMLNFFRGVSLNAWKIATVLAKLQLTVDHYKERRNFCWDDVTNFLVICLPHIGKLCMFYCWLIFLIEIFLFLMVIKVEYRPNSQNKWLKFRHIFRCFYWINRPLCWIILNKLSYPSKPLLKSRSQQ